MAKFIKLELKNDFNHKCILENQDLMSSTGLDNQGIPEFDHFSVASTCPDSKEIVEADGIPFIFPDKSINIYDNIECCEQTIEIPSGEYKSIHILGFTVFQNSSQIFKLIYEDGNEEEISLSFIDWYNAHSKTEGSFVFEKSIMDQYCNLAIKAKSTEGRDIGFFHTFSPIKNSGKIVGMQMPFDFNIHILAITLEL